MEGSEQPEVVEAPEVETPEVDHNDRRASLEAAFSQRARDERGRFAKAEEPAEPEPAAEMEPAKPARRLPSSWRKELEPHYMTLPDEIVAEIERRESDYFKGLEPLKSGADRWRSLEQTLAPFQPALEVAGKAPEELIGGLMQAHAALTFGTPEQKAQAFATLAQQYGVNLGGQQPSVDPTYDILREVDARVQRQLNQIREEDAIREVERQVAQFSQGKEHFAAVRTHMGALMQANQELRQVNPDVKELTLEAAYDQACWANPDIRSQLLQEQQQRAEAERKAKAAEAARKARTASVSLNGAPVDSGAVNPDPSNRRAVLEAALRQYS